MMKKILFVEDNDVLRELYGLMLTPDRDKWQTTLAPDAETALKIVENEAFDVVASDMQMPGKNGIELLTEVRKRHPQTSRIIISGIADQQEAAKSLNCTHLFLPKPFEARILRETLARIGSLDGYLKNEKLRALAGRMWSLPSFPALYAEIIQAIESPNSSIQGIAKIVAKDPGITAKVLQVANSAAIGLPAKVNDPSDAVQQLGMMTVRSLVLSAQVYGNFAPGRLKDFSAEALWDHLMKCGELARSIMRQENAEFSETEDAFTAGMLHDMGKLMLADSLPEEYAKAIDLAAQEKISQTEAELAIFGATHAGLAAYLFGLWGLPASIVEAVAFHHNPEQSQHKKFSALTAVHVANSFFDDSGTAPLNHDYLKEIGVADKLNDWEEMAADLLMEEAS